MPARTEVSFVERRAHAMAMVLLTSRDDLLVMNVTEDGGVDLIVSVNQNVPACVAKMLYLQPKWHGSTEEMLRFGQECLQSKNWEGRLPLLLTHAHHVIAGELGEDVCGNEQEPEPYAAVRPGALNAVAASHARPCTHRHRFLSPFPRPRRHRR